MSRKNYDKDWGDENWKDLRDKSISERFLPKKQEINIYPKTQNQKKYIELIKNRIIVLATGCSGAGKTFIPIGIALKMLQEEVIEKLIVTRPMVECGRKLGSMPGDLSEKYGVYIRPIFDNMLKFISQEQLDHYLKNKKIEFIPLELMRGSSIDNSFIILDEAQNVEKTQMLMLLTRIGEGTQVVICGDLEQQDNELNFKDYEDKYQGLAFAMRNLEEDDKNIGKIQFTEEDIVRSEIVRLIISQWKKGY